MARDVQEPARAFARLEEHVKRLEAWREKNAPGSTEAMRQMMASIAAREAKSLKAARSIEGGRELPRSANGADGASSGRRRRKLL